MTAVFYRLFDRGCGRIVSLIGLPALLCLLNACMAIAPGAGSQEVFFVLHDGTLQWSESTELYTNQSAFVVEGSCDVRVSQAKVVISGPGGTKTYTTPCASGGFRFELTDAKKLPSNGDYAMSFFPLDVEGQPFNVVEERVLKYQLRDLSNEIVVNQPSSSGQTVVTPTFDFSGLCSSNYALSLSLSVSSSTLPVSCAKGGGWNFNSVPLVLGANTVDLAWSDEYGNNSSSSLTIIRSLPGAATFVNGMLSGTPSGFVDSSPSGGNRAKLYWSSALPLAAAPNTGQPNPLTIESNPAGRGWVIPGVFGRIVNTP